MAVKVMQGITRYIGTAAEIAAYDISRANIGSTFFESDTGILKILDQSGALVNAPSESSVVQVSGSNFEKTIDAAAPTIVAVVGGKYDSIDPSYDDGDAGVIRINSKGEVAVNLASALDSTYDSINVNKQGKGGVTTAHSAITDTATSAEIDCRGYNAIMLEIVQSAAEAWTYTVQGCMASGGTFVDIYEMANTGALALMTVASNTLNRILVFKGIPDYVKIVATEVAGTATVTVKVQPCNL
ncbi:MAG: hypothetical protein PHG75_01495 [Syntrophomonas sp.]|nr:hypothetical protein [Syntrophomonas sp.]